MKRKESIASIIFIVTKSTVYRSLTFFDSILNRKPDVAVFCYHAIENKNWKYNVGLKKFRKQIKFLKSHYQFISPQEFEDYILGLRKLNNPSALLTFDDGYKNLLSVEKFLFDNKIKPLFFVLSDRKIFSRNKDCSLDLLDKKDILFLISRGWVLGSHGRTHKILSSLSNKELLSEIKDSKNQLEKEFGIEIKHFAYPHGKYSKTVTDIVEKFGYVLGFSTNDGKIDFENRFILPRISIDRTHTFVEFRATISPSIIKTRSLIKKVGRVFNSM